MATTTVQVQVCFKQDTPYGEFSDALYYSPEVYADLSEEQLQAGMAARVAAWVAVIEAPEVPPTAEDDAAALLLGEELAL